MKFFSWALIATVLSLVTFSSAYSAADVVNSFRGLTTLSANVKKTVEKVTVTTFPIVSPEIPPGLHKISNAANQDTAVAKANAGTVFDDPDAVEIVDALKTFVTTQQALLTALIEKHDIINLLPGGVFTEPIRQALISLEQALDTLVPLVVKMIPTHGAEGMRQQDSLDTSLTDAINIYS